MPLRVRKMTSPYRNLPQLCDAFYIGGTKVGALCGESLGLYQKQYPESFYNPS